MHGWIDFIDQGWLIFDWIGLSWFDGVWMDPSPKGKTKAKRELEEMQKQGKRQEQETRDKWGSRNGDKFQTRENKKNKATRDG